MKNHQKLTEAIEGARDVREAMTQGAYVKAARDVYKREVNRREDAA